MESSNLTQIKTTHHDIDILFIDVDQSLSPEKSTLDMASQIENNFTLDIGEYPRKEILIMDLQRKVFEQNSTAAIPSLYDNRGEITKLIVEGIKKTSDYVAIDKSVQVYVFPTANKRLSGELGGIQAFALGRYSLYFFIDIENPEWKENLRLTVPHEYAHLVSFRYVEARTILDAVVFEGLAEKMREHLYGGDPAKYSIAISKEEALKELRNLSPKVTSLSITEDNYNLQLEYLFGSKEIPKWFGYSVGYWLIHEVLGKSKHELKQLFFMQPKEVLNIFLEGR